MAAKLTMYNDWQRKMLLSPEAHEAVNSRADQMGAAIAALGEVDHSGNPIRYRVVHGSRETKRAYAFVGLTNKFARRLEAKRGILNRVR